MILSGPAIKFIHPADFDEKVCRKKNNKIKNNYPDFVRNGSVIIKLLFDQ